MNKNNFPYAPTPEERRRAFIRNSRETTRIVKRTLIVFALLAASYYVFLLKTQSPEPFAKNDAAPTAAETSSSDKQTAVQFEEK